MTTSIRLKAPAPVERGSTLPALSVWSGDTLLFRLVFLVASVTLAAVASLSYLLHEHVAWPQVAVVGAVVALSGACATVAKRGRTDIAGAILVGGMWCATTIYCIKSDYGLHSAAVFMYMPCMLYTALYFGIWIASAELALTLATLLLMYFAEEGGRLGGAKAFAATGSNLLYLIGVTATGVGTLIAGAIYLRRIRLEAERVVDEAARRHSAMEAAQLAQAQVETAHARLTVLNGELQARHSMHADAMARARTELGALHLALAKDLPAALRAGDGAGERLAAQLEEIAVAATVPLRLAAVDLSEIAEAAIDVVQGEFPGVTFSVQPGMRAHADRALAEALLAHLVRRAARACRAEPGSGVRVGTASHEGAAMFFVRDNGPALDAAARERLLQPFGRDGSNAAPDTSVACALAIVARHGGELRIDAGAGTTVMFSLAG